MPFPHPLVLAEGGGLLADGGGLLADGGVLLAKAILCPEPIPPPTYRPIPPAKPGSEARYRSH
jgi:hypothetical protein